MIAFSFNPCCIGLAIAAVHLSDRDYAAALFQSLLYWISHCGSSFVADPRDLLVFQSLLYWISHCGT